MFQSPKFGATYQEKWQPVRPIVRTNKMNQDGSIYLQSFSTVNGEEAVLSELGVDCNGSISNTMHHESSAGKLVNFPFTFSVNLSATINELMVFDDPYKPNLT